MSLDPRCEQTRLEISIAHDEVRQRDASALEHLATCETCAAFARQIDELGSLLATGQFDQHPDVSEAVIKRLAVPRRRWLSVAAVALVGLTVGSVLGLISSRTDLGLASDLSELFHRTGPAVEAIGADIVVVERGVHPEVSERVYSGSLTYFAPETLALELFDTTDYPGQGWIPNNMSIMFEDGDFSVTAIQSCPVPAMPGCLTAPVTTSIINQPPFSEGTLRPLELIGPGRSFIPPSGTEVAGHPYFEGRAAIQVRSTVAAIELLAAVTEHGAWRELHPTDLVLMWLDLETLIPLRIEVFAADTPERDLWQIRRGYEDLLGGSEPIFIMAMSDLIFQPEPLSMTFGQDAQSGGFNEGAVDLDSVVLPEGFLPHRVGSLSTPDGLNVEVASWSDGRAWLVLESAPDWSGDHLFGMTTRFVEQVALRANSVGYLSPQGDSLAIHSDGVDLVIRGSTSRDTMIEVARSLSVTGRPVPGNWVEASIVAVDDLPPGALMPEVEGWSVLASHEEGETTILLVGAGDRSVVISQGKGDLLSLPIGADVSAVEVRGADGRFDAAAGTLEWIEDGLVVTLSSDTVSRKTLLEIAESMSTG